MGDAVNRCLKDKAMNRIDHALGRPVDPMVETYRNYFSTDGDGPLADDFRASPHWREGRRSGSSTFFHVTHAGRAALAEHLREIGDRHRIWDVAFEGFPSTVVGTSRSKARYSHFLSLTDCLPDLTFAEFCRRSTIRAAHVALRPPPPAPAEEGRA